MTRKIATSLDDMPDRAELIGQSGLDFMENMLAGRIPNPPIGDAMGFWVSDVSKGRVSFDGAPQFDSTNTMRGVHGGWYGAILDSALGCAVMTCVPKGALYTTLEYKVNITRAIPLGLQVRATATVSHAGRSTAVASGEVRGIKDGKLYATGSTTCMIMAAS